MDARASRGRISLNHGACQIHDTTAKEKPSTPKEEEGALGLMRENRVDATIRLRTLKRADCCGIFMLRA